MRNLFFLAFISLNFLACTDITEPRPVIQGEVNGILFRSNTQTAMMEGGGLIINGSNLDEVNLQISNDAVGTYQISQNSGTSASFVLDGVSYSTSGPDTSGTIEIEEITNTYVTGNFFFEARRNGTGEALNFSKGYFYQIPFNTVTPPDDEG